MAEYPGAVFAPRTKANDPAVEYDPLKTTVVFAEDVSKLDAEVVATQTELGTNPSGAYATVKAAIEAAINAIIGAFTDIADVPDSYTGQAGKFLTVKTLENGLEFSAAPAPGAHKTSHEDAGADEINVAGLAGELADAQKPKSHNLGGAEHGIDTLANLNLKVSDATLDDSGSARTPSAHKTSHEDAGADEINVAGLAGELTDVQKPKSHAASHAEGGADAVTEAAIGALASITFVIDGGGSPIATGQKGHLEIPFKCEIQVVTLLAGQTGSIVIDIWKNTYANFPPTDANSICSATKPTISSAQKAQDATLTNWTKTINAGDVLAFNVDSAATITRITLALKVKKIA